MSRKSTNLTAHNTLTIERAQVSLRQVVTDKLRTLVLIGELAPGQKLVERDLCEGLGVSRTLLREALQQLQAEGLVTNVLHRGPSVASITEEDARNIYQIRELLEAQAGRGFTLNASKEQIEELATKVDVLRDPTVQGDSSELLAAKNGFYATLLEGCGNRIITQLLTQLNNRISILRRLSMSHSGRLALTIAELDEIVQTVRNRDADKVALLCQAHVARAANAALEEFVARKAAEEAL